MGLFNHKLHTSNRPRLHTINPAMKNNTPNPHHLKYAIPSLFRDKMLVEVSAAVEAQDEGSTALTPKWKRRSRNGRVPTPAKMSTLLAAEAQVG